MTGPCEAWAEAVMAVGRTLGNPPLLPGISIATVGHWTLTLNNSTAEFDGIEPFGIKCASNKFLAVGLFAPSGGCLGGYSEDQFIADMRLAP